MKPALGTWAECLSFAPMVEWGTRSTSISVITTLKHGLKPVQKIKSVVFPLCRVVCGLPPRVMFCRGLVCGFPFWILSEDTGISCFHPTAVTAPQAERSRKTCFCRSQLVFLPKDHYYCLVQCILDRSPNGTITLFWWGAGYSTAPWYYV